MIEGGWEFIGTAYALTWVVLGIYGLSLWSRLRKAGRREGGSS